jgi:hypothetical protein
MADSGAAFDWSTLLMDESQFWTAVQLAGMNHTFVIVAYPIQSEKKNPFKNVLNWHTVIKQTSTEPIARVSGYRFSHSRRMSGKYLQISYGRLLIF